MPTDSNVNNEVAEHNHSPATDTSLVSTTSTNATQRSTQVHAADDFNSIISQAIVQRVSNFFECTCNNRTKACLSARAAVATALMDAGDEREELSGKRVFKNHIINALNIPPSTGFRLFNSAKKHS